MKSPRFWVVLLLLLATFTTLHLRASVDRVPPSEPLSLLPQSIDQWSSQDVPISQDTLDILGDGRFLNRLYTNSTPTGHLAEPPVSLFIGYFPTQRTGQSIHSPQNCLPGAGWSFVSSRKIYLNSPELKNYAVGEYVIANGTAKQVVLYWYLAHGRSIANDYVAKAYMMADAIRYNRTDGALVRLVTPLDSNETLESAHARVVKFADRFVPMLPRFIPN
jgi:EpsI family protein